MATQGALFRARVPGDPTLVESKDFADPPKGRKVQVTFHDNEIWSVHARLPRRRQRFFLHPADDRSNNLRVFVTATGMQRIRFL